MAKATWSREPVVTLPVTFTLELTEDEADALLGLTGEISGHKDVQPIRTYTDVIYRELADAIKAAHGVYGFERRTAPAELGREFSSRRSR